MVVLGLCRMMKAGPQVSSISEVRLWVVAWNGLPLSVLWPQPCRCQVSFRTARTLQGVGVHALVFLAIHCGA